MGNCSFKRRRWTVRFPLVGPHTDFNSFFTYAVITMLIIATYLNLAKGYYHYHGRSDTLRKMYFRYAHMAVVATFVVASIGQWTLAVLGIVAIAYAIYMFIRSIPLAYDIKALNMSDKSSSSNPP